MRTLTYYVAVSLDGRIADPAGGFQDFPVEGDHIDMIVREYPETLPAVALTALGVAPGTRFDTVLMGWNTYAAGLAHGVADPYPHLRQYVFSTTRTVADAAPGIEVTASDPVAVVHALKAEPRRAGIWLCGGGRLATALADEIDRLVLKVNPVVLGDGVPLFAGGYDARRFALEASTAYRSGVVVNEYARVR